MDAVKLDCYSLEVAPPLSRLTESEGFGVIRVSPEPLDSPAERFCSLLAEGRAEPEPRPWTRFKDADLFHDAKHVPCVRIDSIAKQLSYNCEDASVCSTKVEEVKLRKRGGKSARSIAFCPKRPIITRVKDRAVRTDVDDYRSLPDKLGPFPMKLNAHEKSPLARQKNILNCKRGDRRSAKACMKSKFDCGSMKASLASCSTGVGGSSVLGLHCLKTDVQDVSKHVDDISLDDLLDGTYICPSLSRKEEKKSKRNVDILHAVKRACDIFQQMKLVKTESIADSDCCSSERTVTVSAPHCVMGSGDSAASSCFIDQDSESPANLFDFPFAQPLDTLDRMALTPTRDLESLLVEAAKTIGHCKNSPESRASKHLSRRCSLPPFSWSHSNQSKSNDVVKLQSRITCHGRWVRLGNYVCSPRIFTHCLKDLNSVIFDESLIPKFAQKSSSIEMPEKQIIVCCEKNSLVSVMAPITSTISQVEYPPKLIIAAQTLYDMSQDVGRQKWWKTVPSKVTKGRKLKPCEKAEEELQGSTSNHLPKKARRNGLDYKVCSKRAKLSSIDSKTHCHSKGREPLCWSTSKSSRSSSSPKKLAKELGREVRNGAVGKQKALMPPPSSKGVPRECNGQRKVRKLKLMDWSRD